MDEILVRIGSNAVDIASQLFWRIFKEVHGWRAFHYLFGLLLVLCFMIQLSETQVLYERLFAEFVIVRFRMGRAGREEEDMASFMVSDEAWGPRGCC